MSSRETVCHRGKKKGMLRARIVEETLTGAQWSWQSPQKLVETRGQIRAVLTPERTRSFKVVV